MSPTPAFTVRHHPAFRFARHYRVYLDHDALYLIRMGGLVGVGEFGDPDSRLAWANPGRFVIGWLVSRFLKARAANLDERGPRELLDAHPDNRRLDRTEIASARLEPSSILSGATSVAVLTLTPTSGRAMKYQIEDGTSLKRALDSLPSLLGPALTVTVAWDEASGLPVRRRS